MSLSKGQLTMKQVTEICKAHYDQKNLEHADRVWHYVTTMGIIPPEFWEDCEYLALMYDLLEDTDYTGEDLPLDFLEALKFLTKPKDMKYTEYCKKLRPGYHATDAQRCAYYVKIADMKDHLAQTETLTDRLKKKYLEGLAELL